MVAAVELRFFAVREYKGELENRIFKDMRWANRSELPSFDFLEADLDWCGIWWKDTEPSSGSV